MAEFNHKVVVITGASHGIGLAVRKKFEAEGARVYAIDIQGKDCYIGDISKKETLEDVVS